MEHTEEEPSQSPQDDMSVAAEVIENKTMDDLQAALLLSAITETNTTLKAQLTEMWSEYLQRSSSISLKNFLSLPHLGNIFEHLSLLGK